MPSETTLTPTFNSTINSKTARCGLHVIYIQIFVSGKHLQENFNGAFEIRYCDRTQTRLLILYKILFVSQQSQNMAIAKNSECRTNLK